jgi:integrase
MARARALQSCPHRARRDAAQEAHVMNPRGVDYAAGTGACPSLGWNRRRWVISGLRRAVAGIVSGIARAAFGGPGVHAAPRVPDARPCVRGPEAPSPARDPKDQGGTSAAGTLRACRLRGRRELRPDLRVAVTLAHAVGWRMQSEVLPLALRQVDLQSGTIRLDPGQAKNEEGRVVYLPADLKVLVAAQVKKVRALERKLGRIIPHLFPHLRGRHRGERIKDFRRVGQGPAGAPRSGRCCGTTSGARRSGIW